jgi:radical SAM protein with 4Fe4S-binding SPASM domain
LEDQWSRFIAWQVVHAEVYALARLNSKEILEPGRAEQAADSDTPLEASQLRQLATWVEEVADENAFQVTWLPPVGVTQKENAADQARRGPRAGGDVTIRVLGSGDVLPPRGARQSAGNLLTNSWAEIWGSSVFRRFRQRVEANTRCEQCPGLAICAADCPADPGGWSHD